MVFIIYLFIYLLAQNVVRLSEKAEKLIVRQNYSEYNAVIYYTRCRDVTKVNWLIYSQQVRSSTCSTQRRTWQLPGSAWLCRTLHLYWWVLSFITVSCALYYVQRNQMDASWTNQLRRYDTLPAVCLWYTAYGVTSRPYDLYSPYIIITQAVAASWGRYSLRRHAAVRPVLLIVMHRSCAAAASRLL